MPNIAYVNGKWLPLSLATVSVEDRGFQFGDGAYELIRTYRKNIFHLEEHLKRLDESLKTIGISIRYTPDALAEMIHAGVKKSRYPDVKIYIQVTRGVAPRFHPFPKRVQPTLVMTFRKCDPVPKAILDKGISVISVEDIRWDRCHVKSLNLLPNVMAREQAVQAGAYEALFARDGWVWEGAGSNLFAVFGKKVVTPPKGPYLLSGITREIVLRLGQELKRSAGLSIREQKVSLRALYHADELFLTGTTVEIVPVVRLDGKKIGTGKPGKITRLLHEAFQKEIF